MGQPAPPLGVRAVLFDAVGTLIRPRPPVAEAYVAAGRRLGIELSREDALVRFQTAFASEEALDSGGATSEERERRRWQRIVETVFPEVSEASDRGRLFAALWDHFARARNWSLDHEAAEVIARLAAAGLKVGVASNFDRRLMGLCAAWPTLARVPVFVSSAIGWRKPDRRFFELVSAQLALPAEQLLMVGDDLENDYFGAVAAGWQAVHLLRPDRGQAAAALSGSPAGCRINRLIDLLPLLSF